MKYRMLNNEELISLEEDLKAFLIVNGIDGSTWENINKTKPEKAIELVEMFSDLVLQKVYEKLEYLEHRTELSCIAHKFSKHKIEGITIVSNDSLMCNLSSPESLHEALTKHSDKLTFYKGEKNIESTKEEEIHRCIENGFHISHREFWDALERMVL
jgi:hypothetical protein